MTRHVHRVSHAAIVVACLTFLLLWLDPASSVPVSPRPVPDPPPDLEEVAMLEALADWVVGSDADGPALDDGLPDDLTQLIRERPHAFELFRRVPGEEARHSVLLDLPYGETIASTASRHSLDALLLAALVEVESSFSHDAVSPQGAVGLTQVLPSTAAWMGHRGDLTDPIGNLEVGASYLSDLLDEFDGDLELALAAYNAGPGAVRRHGGVPPYRETRSYVRKVLQRWLEHQRQVWSLSDASEETLVAGLGELGLPGPAPEPTPTTARLASLDLSLDGDQPPAGRLAHEGADVDARR